MNARDMRRLLTRLHRGPSGLHPEFRDRLEGRLIQEHSRLYGRQASGTAAWRWVGVSVRPLLATLFLLVVVAGVGALPAAYQVRVGTMVEIGLENPGGSSPGVTTDALLEDLIRAGAAEQISVSMDEGGDNRTILLFLMGEEVSLDALKALLTARDPAFATARFTATPLAANIGGTLAERIGHSLALVEVSTADLQAARTQILMELAERGSPAERVVIEEDGTRRRLRIETRPGE